MNYESQKMVIAKAVGRCVCATYKKPGDWETAVCDGCGENPFHAAHAIPEYPGDLKAMHEAEKLLSARKTGCLTYCTILAGICGCDCLLGGFEIVHASAPQRAEAFLRTLHLWETPATNKEENATAQTPPDSGTENHG